MGQLVTLTIGSVTIFGYRVMEKAFIYILIIVSIKHRDVYRVHKGKLIESVVINCLKIEVNWKVLDYRFEALFSCFHFS